MKKIEIIFLDVDGVMTDGKKYIFENNIYKSFDVKDGAGIKKAIELGISVVILTTDDWDTIYKRAEHLSIEKVYTNCKNKLKTANGYCREKNIPIDNSCFIGDDINDEELMKHVGLPACPKDAVKEIKEIVYTRAGIISKKKGGDSCVRDIIETIISRNNFLKE
tara:strand:- start:708 stop:1199 length:492 start_codon:yes stop_codon:yes gene_type:complete